MAKKGFAGKKISEKCSGCGVEWLEDKSNKVPRRAICYPCRDIEYQKRNEEERKKTRLRGDVSQLQKKSPYTFKNRKPYWQSIANELRAMKKREEWLPYIRTKMDAILNDTQLMDYINETQIADYDKD